MEEREIRGNIRDITGKDTTYYKDEVYALIAMPGIDLMILRVHMPGIEGESITHDGIIDFIFDDMKKSAKINLLTIKNHLLNNNP